MTAAANSLDGRVAVVTGAGQGLGLSEAKQLADLGALVVVNDVGRTESGQSLAQRVADEIVATGGRAVADTTDISDFDAGGELVARTVAQHGSFDILVNNAGVLRDRILFNMSESEWDDVLRVHLKGHFVMSRWAVRHWHEQFRRTGAPVYARIVNTSSEAFINGGPGQPNYASAKAGIVQLTISAAKIIAEHGGTANAICPRALTQMTAFKEVFSTTLDDGFQPFAPEHVAPLVGYLASGAAAGQNGQVFVVYGRSITLLGPPTIANRWFTEDSWSVDGVAKALAQEPPTVSTFATTVPVVL